MRRRHFCVPLFSVPLRDYTFISCVQSLACRWLGLLPPLDAAMALAQFVPNSARNFATVAAVNDPHGVEEARARLRSCDQQMRKSTWAMTETFGLADCSALPALFYAEAQEHQRLSRTFEGASVHRPRVEGSRALPSPASAIDARNDKGPEEANSGAITPEIISRGMSGLQNPVRLVVGRRQRPVRQAVQTEQDMRFMVIVKASKDTEAGVMPSTELLTAMGKFNEEMVKAGVMQAGEGLHPTSKGARMKYSGGQPAVEPGSVQFQQRSRRRLLADSDQIAGRGDRLDEARAVRRRRRDRNPAGIFDRRISARR